MYTKPKYKKQNQYSQHVANGNATNVYTLVKLKSRKNKCCNLHGTVTREKLFKGNRRGVNGAITGKPTAITSTKALLIKEWYNA